MSFLERLLGPIIHRVLQWLGPFGDLLRRIVDSYASIRTIFDRAQKFVSSVISEGQEWNRFRANFAWRTRVINLKIAYEQTSALVQQILGVWSSIKDLIKDAQQQIKGAPEPEELATDIAEGVSLDEGVSGLAKLFPKLARLGTKILGVVTILLNAAEGISRAIDDLQQIVDAVTALRQELEFGSTIFLSQKNPRRTIKLADGGSMKIRLGNLHS